MNRLAYPASIEEDEGGFFLATFPDLPGAATDGRTREEALEDARDCLEEAIAYRIHAGTEVPEPSQPKRGQTLVDLPAQMAAKAALYLAVREAGITKHATKLPRIEAALSALGKRLVIEVRAA
ncbi:type II toxin-antitoxin system HicB family antitoxin [Endothiovibrio diazotrophicus]